MQFFQQLSAGMVVVFILSLAGEVGRCVAQDAQVVITVTTDNAPLQQGQEILARVPQGRRLSVFEVRGDWFLVQATVEGREIKGWLHKRHTRVVATNPVPAVTPEQKEKLTESAALRERAKALWEKRQYEDTIPLNQKALEIRRAVLGPEHLDTAEAMWALGLSYDYTDRYDEARPLQEEALRIRRRLLGERHPDVATSMDELGGLVLSRDPALAKRYFEAALAIRQRELGEKHQDTARSYESLGNLSRDSGDYAAALKYHERALAIRRELLGDEHLETADSLYYLGEIHLLSGDAKTAQTYLRRALAICEEALGKDHREIASTLTQLGRAHQQTDDFAVAKTCFERTLAIRRKIFGEEHPFTAFALSDIEALLTDRGDYAAARPYAEKVLEIVAKAYGEEHAHTATAVNNLAVLHTNMGDYATAKTYYERALAIRLKVASAAHPDTAAYYHNLGAVHHNLGDYVAARRSLEQALTIRKNALGDTHPSTASTRDQLGIVLGDLGEFDAAVSHLERALEVRTEAFGEDSLPAALSRNNLAALRLKMGAYAGALADYEKVLAVYTSRLGEKHPDTAQALLNLGEMHGELGEYEAGLAYLNRALAIRRELANHSDAIAEVLDALGEMHRRRGDNAAARIHLEEALAMRREALGEEDPRFADSLNSLAMHLGDTGDFEAARRHHLQALAIFRKAHGDTHVQVATTHHNLGLLDEKLQRYAAARDHYAQAYAICQKVFGDSHLTTARALGSLGVALAYLGQHDQAQDCLQRARDVVERGWGQGHHIAINLTVQLGIVQSLSGDYAAARGTFEKSLAANTEIFGKQHSNVATGHSNLAVVLALLGNNAEAAAQFDAGQRSLQLHAARVLPILSAAEQLAFLYGRADRLDKGLSFALWRRHDPSLRALSAEWLLNAKGVSQETLAANVRLSDEASQLVLGQLRAVRDQMSRLSVAATDAAAREKQLIALRRQETQLLRQLGQFRLGQRDEADPWVPLSALRDALAKSENSVLVNFARFRYWDYESEAPFVESMPDRYGAWIVPAAGRGDVSLVDLGEAAPIDDAIRAARTALQLAPKTLREQSELELERAAKQSLQAVSALILKPLEENLQGYDELILCPDRSLWLAPWAALPLTSGEYLIERHAVRYVTSGRELVTPGAAGLSPEPPAIVADPDYNLGLAANASQPAIPAGGLRDLPTFARLAASEAEARAIKPSLDHFARQESQMLLNRAATEAAVKSLASPHVLVLSTHGFFLEDRELPMSVGKLLHGDERSAGAMPANRDNPLLRCGLLLAGCNNRGSGQIDVGDDGVLTGLEIVGVDLHGTKLVVLSACETGVGEVRNGEGVAGLRQAFQLAGAEAVVASLWSVPDLETARLMKSFFEHLAAGKSKAAALRAAQLERIASRRERFEAAHPFYWAAFTVTGR